MLNLSREQFLELAKGGGPIPVTSSILADMETPLSAYWKLASEEEYSFLFESVTGGEQLARYSMIGFAPVEVVKASLSPGEPDPLAAAFAKSPKLRPEFKQGLPRLCGGAVGWIGYDYVRLIEKLPLSTVDDIGLDTVGMMIMDKAVVFDHAKNLIQMIVLAEPTASGYEKASSTIDGMKAKLRAPKPPLPEAPGKAPDAAWNMTPDDYEESVRRSVQYIIAGDAFQIVPSQRLEAECTAHPMLIYRALRSMNPSPYMFLLRCGDTSIVGASPEILVAVEDGTAKVRPIAGTRPRGNSPEEDEALAADLLKDEKERAEHIMLVDLGRNDLGRVCDYGSVKVKDLMVIERYSHVMHIVSEVTGRLREGLTPEELIRATFPAGTLSGAPKVRAMEIIEELEPTRRGLYGGAVGYLSASGDLDLAIAIRTALIKNGKVYVQAGAGIVFDSVPDKEHQECRNKAEAVLRAIAMAHEGLDG